MADSGAFRYRLGSGEVNISRGPRGNLSREATNSPPGVNVGRAPAAMKYMEA